MAEMTNETPITGQEVDHARSLVPQDTYEICMITMDDSFRIVSANDAAEKLVGRPGATLIGLHLGALLAASGIPEKAVEAILRSTVQTGWTGNVAIRMVDGSDRHMYLQTSHVTGVTESPKYSLMAIDCGIISKLADSLPPNATHADGGRLWRALFDSLDEGIMLLSPDYTVAVVNQYMCKALDAKPDQLVGRKCHEIIRDSALPCPGCTDLYTPCVNDRPGDRQQLDPADYLTSVAMATDDIGNVISRKLRVKHVVEERGTGIYLYDAGRLVALGELATGVAHNFGNVLMSVSTTLELLHMRADTGQAVADLKDTISGALDQVDKGAQIIQRLMALAKGMPSIAEAVDVRSAADSAIALCQTHRSAGRVELVNEVPPDTPPCRADEGQFIEVLVNLILNALQSSERGTIRVGAQMGKHPGLLEIYVADQGSGIAPEDMDRIFEPFFTKRTESAGTGLGLPCCMAQVARMGGRLVARSTLGEGSTFSIILPKWTDGSCDGRTA